MLAVKLASDPSDDEKQIVLAYCSYQSLTPKPILRQATSNLKVFENGHTILKLEVYIQYYNTKRCIPALGNLRHVTFPLARDI